MAKPHKGLLRIVEGCFIKLSADQENVIEISRQVKRLPKTITLSGKYGKYKKFYAEQ